MAEIEDYIKIIERINNEIKQIDNRLFRLRFDQGKFYFTTTKSYLTVD